MKIKEESNGIIQNVMVVLSHGTCLEETRIPNGAHWRACRDFRLATHIEMAMYKGMILYFPTAGKSSADLIEVTELLVFTLYTSY